MRHNARFVGVRAALTLVLLVAVSAAASAQTSSRDRRWEIELDVGGTMPHSSSGGTGALPPSGPVLPISFGGVTTRAVSSWVVGDGAQFLNQALSSFRLPQQITPLDVVAQSVFAKRQSGAAVGFRVSRKLNERFAAELSVDYLRADLALTNASLAAVEATRASFISAWNSLLALPLLASSRSATSSATISDHQGRQFAVDGAMIVNLGKGSTRPYVMAGAGIVTHSGGLPSAELIGRYQFQITSLAPLPVAGLVFDQTDTTVVRVSIPTTVVAIIGGGVKHFVTPRWGVRVDVRERIGRNEQPRSSTPLLDRLYRRCPASGSYRSGPVPRWSSRPAGQDRA